jgi:rubrerythrin
MSAKKKAKRKTPAKRDAPTRLRELIELAMELERRTMNLYCRFEALFPKPAAVQSFWLEMAEHESRHVGALALVVGLLDQTPERTLASVPTITRDHVRKLRRLLTDAEAEAEVGVTLTRAFEIALAIEGSEIEDLVLDLMTALKGERQRERGIQLLIHDLGDLSYMIEKYGGSRALLHEADAVVEQQLSRLRGKKPPPDEGPNVVRAVRHEPAKLATPRRRKSAGC